MANTALDPNRRTIAASLRVLLSDLVDYAGLFPPAGLSMDAAVQNYSRYLASEDAWALGRFVLPVSRFGEFEEARTKLVEDRRVWRVSALLGADPDSDIAAIGEFNLRNRVTAHVDAIEAKASSGADVGRIQAHLPDGITAYIEVSPERAPEILSFIKAAGVRAKLRTGGVKPDMFPSPAAVAGFLHECARLEVAFKATAGLHHPLRCTKPLTYETNAPTGVMHGFLNVFLAAALAMQGASESTVARVLENREAGAFRFDDQGVHFQEWTVSLEHLATARRTFAISFGSCSFEEPLADLRELGLL